MIVKKCLINFFKCMKYYLPALAIFCIGLLIGVAGFINSAKNDVNSLVALVDNATKDGSTLNITEFKNEIIGSFKSLPWNNFWQALSELFSKKFILTTITEAVKDVIGEEVLNESLNSSLNSTAEALTRGFVSFSIWTVIGLFSSFIYTKIAVKSSLKMKVPFKQIILVTIINYILNITLVSFATYLLALAPIGSLFTMILVIFINQGIALFEAYLSRTQKSIKFKKIYTFKNVMFLTLGTLLITLILVFISMIIVAISNQAIGTILIIPLYFILLQVISFNAYSYIKDYYKDLRD